MPKELHGNRYLTKETSALATFITEDTFSFMDFEETAAWYATFNRTWPDLNAQALLGCNDRYYLLTVLLHRIDVLHPWVFARCREVEKDPDGHLDLWARGHFKSTIITFAGIIQEIIRNPEMKIAIFSVVKPIAAAFLNQIKEEFEQNDYLKEVYGDVLYQNPRGIGPDGRPAKWGLARGITVKRAGNPKEATVEAHGLLDGQPTSRHYDLIDFDDVVTQDYLSDDQIRKTTLRFEMADNLGTHLSNRKQVAGTYYHFNDTYVQMRDRGSLKPRIYPATDNGRMDGQPVLLSAERWEKIKRDQRSTVSAQMLLNPVAGTEATFNAIWLQHYDVIPICLNVYILVDPSKGKGPRSDRTAIAVIGIDQGGSKYLLDGALHRMKLSERWSLIKQFKARWEAHPGVQMVRVGYEQYGMLDDLSVIEDMQLAENNSFEIVELGTPDSGGHAKADRIERLEPDIRNSRFYLPCVVHHADYDGPAYWTAWTEEHAARKEAEGLKSEYHIGQIVYWSVKGPTRRQAGASKHRIVSALRRRDENNEIYDLTRAFIDEAVRHPFAPHDDLIDAVARIYDMKPIAPTKYDATSTEPAGLESMDTSSGDHDDSEVAVDTTSNTTGHIGVRI